MAISRRSRNTTTISRTSGRVVDVHDALSKTFVSSTYTFVTVLSKTILYPPPASISVLNPSCSLSSLHADATGATLSISKSL